MAAKSASPRYHLTPAAQRDLDDIFDYTALRFCVSQAIGYIQDLRQACESIALHPLHGQDCSAVRTGYRRWIVGQHAIWFRVEEPGIAVIRILHHRMDAARQLP